MTATESRPQLGDRSELRDSQAQTIKQSWTVVAIVVGVVVVLVYLLLTSGGGGEGESTGTSSIPATAPQATAPPAISEGQLPQLTEGQPTEGQGNGQRNEGHGPAADLIADDELRTAEEERLAEVWEEINADLGDGEYEPASTDTTPGNERNTSGRSAE